MIKDLSIYLRQFSRLKIIIIIYAVWQYISIASIAILHWPNEIIWLNLGLLLAYVLVCPVYESLLLTVLSIPFYVALPNSHFDSFPMWRIVFVVLFVVWFIRDKKLKISQIHFLPWDRYLAFFFGLGIILSILVGQFSIQGIRQAVFFLNVYLLYIVLINSLRSKEQIFEFIRFVIWSLAIIVTLGFTQLFGTFLVNLETFWVYWATNITSLYYGHSFASVALYSNSWFSYSGGRELRMFSIMPDSQSFAYICIFGLCMGTALTRNVFVHVRKWLWSGVRFAGLALIISGTRAVWVGMLAPFFLVVTGYIYNIQKHLAKKYLTPFLIIFILFAISPLINRGLDYLRVEKFHENFLSRIESIYNIKEASNQGRIEMWQSSAIYAIKHPWGVGFGNFMLSFNPNFENQTYQEAAGKIIKKYNLPAEYVSAHSLYLQVLVETGFFGLIVFMLFWIKIVKYFWNFIKNYKNKEDFLVYFVAQALLVVVWILVAGIFDITLFNDKVLMYFFINIGLAGLIVKKYQEYEES